MGRPGHKPVLDAKLDALRGEIRTGLAELWSELKGELGGAIGGVQHEIAELRVGLAASSASVDERLRRQTWISTSTLITGLGLALEIARFA